MSRIFKRILRLSMSLFLVLATLAITPTIAKALDANGNVTDPSAPGFVTLDKSRDNGTNGVYEITLTAVGIPDTKDTDIVLVIDTSGSMNNAGRMEAAITAAKQFVDDVLTADPGNRIAVVSFHSYPEVKHALSSSKSNLETAINGLNADGGTHLEGGIYEATKILNAAGPGRQKAIVVLSDGEPTYGYQFDMGTYTGPIIKTYTSYNNRCRVSVADLERDNDANYTGNRFAFDFSNRIGSGSSINFSKDFQISGTCPENGKTDTRDFSRSFSLKDSAVELAGQAKAAGIKVFSIGLSVNATGTAVLTAVQDAGYYPAAGPANLASIYANIAAIISPAATNATVTDVMGAGFTFIGVSSGYEGETTSFAGNTLTWSVGSISSATRTLKYKVQINPGLDTNTYPTNQYANLNYTNIVGESAVKPFPIPEVDIVKINYIANVGGSVSNASESLDPVLGVSVGSVATAAAGFTFVNWTNGSTVVSTNATFNPVKVGGKNIAATYHANFTENDKITINYQATTGGSVSLASETLAPVTGVAVGSIATPAAGYEFVNWTRDGNPVSTSANYIPPKIGGLNEAATYVAHFKESKNITIQYIANIGGSVSNPSESLAPATGIAVGSSATAAAGYTFANWTNGSTIVSTNPNYIPPKVGGLNIAATYHANFTENDRITINYQATTGGSVSLASETLAPATGNAVGSTANPAAGYSFVNWTKNGVEVSTSANYIPPKSGGLNVAATYIAHFEENQNITINYLADLGGTVNNASENLAPATGVAVGSLAASAAGYEFVNWTKDGVEVSTALHFIPEKVGGLNVAATYTAHFREAENITINYEATSGGTINNASESLAPATGVAVGSLAAPLIGYHFVNWTKDGVEVSTALNFVPAKVGGLNVAATYVAHFAENANITINYEATAGGSVTNASESLAPATGVAVGSLAAPAAGYSFVNWTKDGVEVSTALNFVPAKVGGLNVAATYVAHFAEHQNITINYEATLGGTVNNASETLAPATGVAVGSLASPLAGYHFVNWTKDGVEVSTSANYIPPKSGGLNVAATYVAHFEEDENIMINYEATTGGSVSNSNESLAPATGTAVGSIATPAAGYTFTKWTKDGLEVSFDATFVPAKIGGLNVAATYVAHFTENQKITINYEALLGGSVSNPSETLSPATGVAVGSLASASAGYTFVAWTNAAHDVVSLDVNFVPDKVGGLNIAATYYANFIENPNIMINYEATVGGSVNNPSESLAPATGVAVGSLASPTTGYSFVNWTKDGLEVSTALNFVPEKDDGLNVAATYVANFVANDYTFTFDPNHGTDANVEQIFQVGGDVAGTTFTREGFTFIGWTTDEAGLIPYVGGLTNLPANDIYVYAQWQEVLPEEYVLTYVTNQPGLVIANVIFNEGDAITSPTPTAEGFTFLGWYKDAAFTALFTEFGSMPANDVTVYADWGEVLGDEDGYVITFVTNQPSITIPNVEYIEGEAIAEPKPTVDGYTFLGWYLDKEFTQKFDKFNSMPGENVIVYADWGQVLGDDDIVDTSDNTSAGLGLLLFALGAIAILISKKEDEVNE